MHDFVSYLFYLLQRGMRFAVPAALVCGLILAVCYAVCRRQGRRFPWGRAVCAVLLVGWAAVTVFVTLLRSESGEFAVRQCNLQLFLAWREAYQRFTLQIWLNVLLNIALFVPLGFLLPLLSKLFRKWYAALGAVAKHPARNLVIVQMGTAITVDSVRFVSPEEYAYLGGRIAPGPTMMFTSLRAGTARLKGEMGTCLHNTYSS